MIKVAVAQKKDLGGFFVSRAIPQIGLKTVGPFVFLDQMGPAEFLPGQAMDVRPHPHIGLSTLTYLFAGRIFHRDSLGNEVIVKQGEVNWMTAGSGIVHSERALDEDRDQKRSMHGIQFWVALPPEKEAIKPEFQHLDEVEIPVISTDTYKVKVVAGNFAAKSSQMKAHTPTLLLDFELSNTSGVDLNIFSLARDLGVTIDELEIAVYPVKNKLEVSGLPEQFMNSQKIELAVGELFALGAQIGSGANTSVKASIPTDLPQLKISGAKGSRFVVLGGKKLNKKPMVWWNFLAYEAKTMEQAKARWRDQKFPKVPNETEFIPLPKE